jgi:carbamate kinase
MKVVVALGGNALLRRGEPLEPERQRAAAARAARALAPVAEQHTVIVTHGNGPQVGLLSLQAGTGEHAFPLDVLDAESEGMIGYVLEQELSNVMPDRDVATVLTRVRVDEHDLAFLRPTKPVGPMLDEDSARALASANGWAVGRDGDGWRRIVASPEPVEVVPLRAIALLVDAGTLVICAGGGGIPVMRNGQGLKGAPAVIDKDLASALLATQLDADVLVLATDQKGVFDHFEAPDAHIIRDVTPDELRRMHFAPGTMGPKIDAVMRFVDATGGRAAIGALEDVAALVAGTAGTQVHARAKQAARL